jgi:hypothetical protein
VNEKDDDGISTASSLWLNRNRDIKHLVINRNVVFDFLDFDFHLVNRSEFANAVRELDSVDFTWPIGAALDYLIIY